MSSLKQFVYRNIYSKIKTPPSEHPVNWMPEAGIAYFRVPKAGNSSVRAALARGFGLRSFNGLKPMNDQYWTKQPNNLAQAQTLKTFMRHAQAQKSWSFTVIRHPVSRLYSCYNNKVLENEHFLPQFADMGVTRSSSFDDFVERVAEQSDHRSDVHIRSQCSFFTSHGRVLPQFIGRLENIETDWDIIRAEVKARAGVNLGRLPSKNRRQSHQTKIKDIASPETLKLIEARYARDFELFYA